MNESQYDALCRMTQNDNLDGLAAAFRSIAPQWPGITARQEKQTEPELPQVASGAGYL